MEHLLNAEGNKKERQLDSDRPGQTFSSAPGVNRHAMGPEQVKYEESAKKFTNRICKTLELARTQGRFGNLVLVAEPHFLGMLKNSLSAPLKKCVSHLLNREYMDNDPKVRAKILAALELQVR